MDTIFIKTYMPEITMKFAECKSVETYKFTSHPTVIRSCKICRLHCMVSGQ